MIPKKSDKSLIQKNFYNSKFGLKKSKDKPLTQKNNSENIDLKKRNFLKKSVLGLAGIGGIVAFSKFTKAWIIFRDGTSQSTAASGGGGTAFISSTDLSNDATFNFTAFDSGSYDAYMFIFMGVVPATDNVHLWLRTSTDGGSTYESGASDYDWEVRRSSENSDSGAADDNSFSDSKIALTGDAAGTGNTIGSAAGEGGVSGTILLYGPHLAKQAHLTWNLAYEGANTAGNGAFGWGNRETSADVDGLRILFSSGNLESGTITVLGVNNA